MRSTGRPFLILALATAFQSGALGSSRVICIGPDGHMAIESERSACCGGESAEPAASPTGEFGVPEGFDPCRSCTDIPLFNASEFRPDHGGAVWALQAADTFSFSLPETIPSLERLLERDGRSLRSLSDLRTVFLRR